MEKAQTDVSELFDELKKELFFLPEVDFVRQGFINGFIFTLLF